MKIGAHFAPKINGVNMDQIMATMRLGTTGKIIDVVDDEDGEHVKYSWSKRAIKHKVHKPRPAI